ncbi:MAG: hypothetical protein LQ338_000979 [Usnochroma carphineum]|nr:MAG: hypothetical protein LQ338_000979 [Usnochroma carphineum]
MAPRLWFDIIKHAIPIDEGAPMLTAAADDAFPDNMLLRWILSRGCFGLLLVNAPLAVDGRYAIVPRQDSPSTTSRHDPSTQTPSPRADSARGSREASQTAAAPTSTPPGARSTQHASEPLASTTGFSTSVEDATSTSSSDPAVLTATPIANSSLVAFSNTTQTRTGELPIKPTITPALSVAGAFLMLSGFFYTLVGIKVKWLQISLSAAYLTSLATTVLIVYVMHPPVSNAVQGAYFVAALVTGVIFGGGSVIFADVTEGLGCLLGGYSLAMWFLVLTPGGLIKSTAGKVIFIACFTLGAFGFYVSHWTRAYGLIGAISFAGATAIVLGIDCFSRAGLKEFWLYIWNLNENIYPLHYRGPYPITRGIRVEIAAIVIIFLIGIMSQMKIWKIIKRRREERDAEKTKREQLEAQAEVDLGRRIEEDNDRDRMLWEAAYGTKCATDRHVDSGLGTEAPSVGKASPSIVGTNETTGPWQESIELDDLERGSSPEAKGKARATVTVRVASDDDVVVGRSSATASTADTAEGDDTPSGPQSSLAGASSPLARTRLKEAKPSAGPKVVPLPFNVPRSDLNDDKRSSIAASIASEHFSRRVLKRLSGGSLKRTSSKKSQRSYMATSTSEEALMIPWQDEDDRASSVEAAVDEVSDGNRSEAGSTTLAGLPSPAADKLLKFSPPTEPHPVERPGQKISDMSLNQTSSQAAPAHEEAATGGDMEKHESTVDQAFPDPGHKPRSKTSEAAEGGPHEPAKMSKIDTNPESGSEHEKPALRDSLADLDSTSKVVMAYRTNEWAKHLDRADKPSLDDLRSVRPERPACHATTAEKAAPVDVPALQQTPTNAEPAPAVPLPKLHTAIPHHVARSTSPKSQDSLPDSPLQQRTPSQTSLDSLPSHRGTTHHNHRTSPQSIRRNSWQTQPHRTTGRHHASTPVANTPIDEDIPSTTFPQRTSHSQPQHPLPTTNTLMSRRESMLQSRPSSTSLTRGSYTPFLTRTPSSSFEEGEGEEADSIPLSHRRALLKERNNRQSRTPSSHYPYPIPSLTHPQPTPLNMRTPLHPAPRASAHLTDLLVQKRRAESGAQQAALAKRNSEQERDARWRSGSGGAGMMEERHREAMRRMQSRVSSG